MSLRDKYCADHIKNLEPYIPGYQPEAGDRILKLNSNENAYPPSPQVIQAMSEAVNENLRLYPNSRALGLRRKLAEVYSLEQNEVFASNGADEIITLIFRTFTEPGDLVAFSYPTYTYYASSAQIHNVAYHFVETDDDFRINLNDYLDIKARLVFLANPNAHTGLVVTPTQIETFLAAYDGLLVVDETYIDFAEPGTSVYQLIRQYDNLIVLRTFSKAFSLCGIRVGYAFARPELVEALDMTKDSYNVAYLNQVAAVAALNDYAYMVDNAAKIRATREWFSSELSRLGFTVLPSNGNFVFAKHSGLKAEFIYQALLKQGILVRYFNTRRMDEFLRISIGSRPEMERVATAIAGLL